MCMYTDMHVCLYIYVYIREPFIPKTLITRLLKSYATPVTSTITASRPFFECLTEEAPESSMLRMISLQNAMENGG